MNEQQAKAALRKMYGTKAAWRRRDDAPIGEAREELGATLEGLHAAVESARAARDARRAELLKDPEYMRLCEAAKAASAAADKASGDYRSRRVTVGWVSNVAGLGLFNVTGEGDNWHEAIEAARAKAGPS